MSKLRQNNLATARREHPIQSHEAADNKNASGTITADQLEVLTYIDVWPGYTAKQLDMWLDGKAHRRSGELLNKKWITGGKRMWITPLGRAVLERAGK